MGEDFVLFMISCSHAVQMYANVCLQVHAFDPSPTTRNYMRNQFAKDFAAYKEVLPGGRYHFHEVGGGGTDGDAALFGYNWDQVYLL